MLLRKGVCIKGKIGGEFIIDYENLRLSLYSSSGSFSYVTRGYDRRHGSFTKTYSPAFDICMIVIRGKLDKNGASGTGKVERMASIFKDSNDPGKIEGDFERNAVLNIKA